MSRLRRALRRLLVVVLVAGGLGLVALLAFAAWNPKLAVALAYYRNPAGYTVPVAGVAARDLRSTWHAPRSGGRKHKGVDIFAPRGTPVVSATDGVVWRVGENSLGGRVVWVVGEGFAVYYYAHLDEWAPGLLIGDRVTAGDVLGTVGNTGNARTTPAHLHFSINRFTPGGILGVDPVPVLKDATTIDRRVALARPRAWPVHLSQSSK